MKPNGIATREMFRRILGARSHFQIKMLLGQIDANTAHLTCALRDSAMREARRIAALRHEQLHKEGKLK
jgi:hypothetical protein